MSKQGAMIGGTIALLFYVFLSMITPLDGKSVIPTAHVVADPESRETYQKNLPLATMLFIIIEAVGIILGVIGYKILVESTS